MNDLLSALKIGSFDLVLSAYRQAGLDLGDAIDGGAGAGKTAAEMLPFLNESAKVYAFEPFPGNHRFFEGMDRRVQLVPSALAEANKTMNFAVRSTVQSDSTWGERGMTGYSSAGQLVSEPSDAAIQFAVECVRADSVVPVDRRVGFIKLDLQGGELNALLGCTALLPRVALMWIEFTGQKGVLQFLADNDFMVFDTEYFFRKQCTDEARQAFSVRRENVVLSNNNVVWFGFRKHRWVNYEAEMLRYRKDLGMVQTDLACINKKYLSEFMAAAPYLGRGKSSLI